MMLKTHLYQRSRKDKFVWKIIELHLFQMHQVIAQAHFHNILSSFHIPKPSKAQRESPKYDIFPSFKIKIKKTQREKN